MQEVLSYLKLFEERLRQGVLMFALEFWKIWKTLVLAVYLLTRCAEIIQFGITVFPLFRTKSICVQVFPLKDGMSCPSYAICRSLSV